MRTFTKAFIANFTHTAWNNNFAERTAKADRMKAPHLLPSWNTNNGVLFVFLFTRAGVNRSFNVNGGRFKASAKKQATSTQQSQNSAAVNGEITYEIKSGDTLGVIARKYGTSVSAICKRNGISDPRKIRAGQKIIIASTAAPKNAAPAKASATIEKPATAQAAQPSAQPAQPSQTTQPAPQTPAQSSANEIVVTSDSQGSSSNAAAAPAQPSQATQPAPQDEAAPAVESETIPVIEI